MNFPPFYVVKYRTEPKGFLLKLLQDVLKEANIDYYVSAYPPRRLFTNIAIGKVHLWMGIKGISLYDKKVIYSRFITEHIELRFYFLEGTNKIYFKEDLRGKRLISILGYGYGGLSHFLKKAKNRITLYQAVNHRSALLMLKLRRAKYLLNYRGPVNQELKRIKMPKLRYTTLSKIPLYFVVSKKTPHYKEIMRRLEDAYLSLKSRNLLPNN
ncbi:MAG: polar amino acid transport system substrate-binding protein [bacterium]|jgi:polar amino acid transport system substrate-binding protein